MDLGARIKGKRIFVTGASGGLGEHFAKVCARNGAAVVVGARRREKLDALVAELKGLGAAEAVAVDLDVADEASVEAALSAAGMLDVIVNNAGIAGGGTALDTPAEDFDRVIDTNLRGGPALARRQARRCHHQHRLDPRLPGRRRRRVLRGLESRRRPDDASARP
jgi:NAD(P)-dependent dehydrogenase (short-subunit alcohol dehydrogenase family)